MRSAGAGRFPTQVIPLRFAAAERLQRRTATRNALFNQALGEKDEANALYDHSWARISPPKFDPLVLHPSDEGPG